MSTLFSGRTILKVATLLFGLCAAIWIILEGQLWRAVGMGTFAAALLIGSLLSRLVLDRRLSRIQIVAVCSLAGLLFGFGSGFFTLSAMTIKTGLHGHGPEFTREQISWVVHQMPRWSLAGLVGGLGSAGVFLSFREQ